MPRQPLNLTVFEFAVAHGFQPISSDIPIEQAVERVMRELRLNRSAAENCVLDPQREELEQFFWKRFNQRPSTL
jgi:hypothetical protein